MTKGRDVLGWIMTTVTIVGSDLHLINEWLTFFLSLGSIGFILIKYYKLIFGSKNNDNK